MTFLSHLFGSSARYKSITFTNYESVPKLPVIADQLRDNLSWECSSCRARVSTKDPHLHLIPCLMSSIKRSKSEQSQDKFFVRCRRAKSMEATQADRLLSRPRTKRLDRPTPNLRHPIIDSSKESPSQSQVQLRIQGSSRKIDSTNSSKPRISLQKNKSRSFDVEENEVSTESEESSNYKVKDEPPQPRDSKEKSKPVQRRNRASTVGCERMYSHQCATKSRASNYVVKQSTVADAKSSKGDSQPKKNVHNIDKSVFLPSEDDFEEMKEVSTNGEHVASHKSSTEMKTVASRLHQDWQNFNAQLSPCPKCGRTFFPHRLDVHERACKGTTTEVPRSEGALIRPKLLEDSEFKEDLRQGENSLPKRAHYQDGGGAFAADDTDDLLSTSADQSDSEWQNHLEVLRPCARCKRTFFPERLEKHEPHCKAKPVQADGTASRQN